MNNLLFYADIIQDDAGAIYIDSPYDLFIEETFIQVQFLKKKILI